MVVCQAGKVSETLGSTTVPLVAVMAGAGVAAGLLVVDGLLDVPLALEPTDTVVPLGTDMLCLPGAATAIPGTAVASKPIAMDVKLAVARI
jgi:hypothetical protein